MRLTLVVVSLLVFVGVLEGCSPHIRRTDEDKFYYFPKDAPPWRELSNGIDLYWWYECYLGPDTKRPDCHEMELMALRRGDKPDWGPIPTSQMSNWEIHGQPRLSAVLSAHNGTNRRVIGMADDGSARYQIYMLRGGWSEISKLEPRESSKLVSTFDVYHNADSRCSSLQLPRFVAYDDRYTWIFADPDPRCASVVTDRYAPVDLMQFDVAGLFDDVLRKPMQLFYIDHAEPDASDFRQPRAVISDANEAHTYPREVVALENIYVPRGRSFILDAGVYNYPVLQSPDANMRCHFSETRFFMTIFEDTTNVSLDYCKPVKSLSPGQ